MPTARFLAGIHDTTEDEIHEILDAADIWEHHQDGRPCYGADAIELLAFAFGDDQDSPAAAHLQALHQPQPVALYCARTGTTYTTQRPKMFEAMRRLATRDPQNFQQDPLRS